MENLKIALLQLMPGATTEENLEKGLEACRKAKTMGADIALFPEMWSDGYDIPEDPEELDGKSVPADGDFVRAFRELAAELKMAVAVTILERGAGNESSGDAKTGTAKSAADPAKTPDSAKAPDRPMSKYAMKMAAKNAAKGTQKPAPKNSLLLFDMNGQEVLRYSKVHTCDFGDEARLSRGDAFFAEDLETEKGWVRVGAMICYDREFPESARILMLEGAELILVPNACPMEINRLSQLRGRAYENMLAIATCNYPAGQPDCNGHSTLFDGVAYLPDEEGSRETCVLEAGPEEGIFLAELDVDTLRTYRAEEVQGNAYRRPDRYSLLLSEEQEYPFLRSDRRK